MQISKVLVLLVCEIASGHMYMQFFRKSENGSVSGSFHGRFHKEAELEFIRGGENMRGVAEQIQSLKKLGRAANRTR